MPVKFPKSFGRRKSTANQFEDGLTESVVEHSFKVFERLEEGSKSFDGGLKFAAKATAAPIHGRTKTLHTESDNMFENVMKNRGSGASNTNTASTTDNSSRLSAASTAPSSTDAPPREDLKSPNERPFDINVPPIPKSSSAFSLKNAGRTLSWGRHKHPSLPSPKEPASPATDDEQAGRSRAVTTSSHATTSSYASTATLTKSEDNELGLSLGGDFSEMFSGFGKRKSVVLDPQTNRSMSNSPEVPPKGPANRNNARLMAPSPLSFNQNKDVEQSPYSWSSQHSREGLISSMSPPMLSGRDAVPPVPKHTSPYSVDQPQSYNKPQPQLPVTADSGLKRSSALAVRRQSVLEYGDAVDEDARLLRESVSASRQMESPGYTSRVRDSWALPSDRNGESSTSAGKYVSANITPKAKQSVPADDEDNIFDTSFRVSANAAQRFQEKPWSLNSYTSGKTSNSPTNKVMTPAQFERYKQDQERLKSIGGKPKDEQDDDEEETYDDEEDDAEKAKVAAKQRRKQEAHMAVYRQQMMKVTGEAPSASRPGVFATQSSPNLATNFEEPEEDEEVPLAILQAHGFPNKGKAPVIRSMGSNPNLRAAGSVSGGVLPAGHLPVFARNLPQDPYYGAGIVTPAHRESMAFGGGAESVAGGPSRGLPPGGLVGVIATEERSRAMRRGSPNVDGTYGQAPSNGNYFGMGAPQGPGSMYNGMPPSASMGPMGSMNPMMTAGDAAQIQMSQQMSQFMQMQMQFMQMMTAGGQQNGHSPQASMGEMPRPNSAHGAQGLRPGSSSHQRAMTMLEPNSVPWMQQGGGMYTPSIQGRGNGYAPSIAPSERSNVGLPGRYRPVSQAPLPKDNRTSTMSMSGGLQNWNKAGPTIKTVPKARNINEDEDEEGGMGRDGEEEG